MTDSRLPARWLIDPVMDGLSDRAWRTFTGSLMWSNEAGTDGLITKRAMRLLHPEGVDSATLRELIEAEIWMPAGADIQIPDWDRGMGQQTADAVERQRQFNRERQRKHRSKSKPAVGITDDVTRDETRESLGQDRDRTGTGQAFMEAEVSNEKPTKSWPTKVPGEDRWAS